MGGVLRVLDIDLDFFVEGVAHFRSRDDGRLSSDDYSAWPTGRVLRFLEEQCLVTEALPGISVEYHAELFSRWRELIDRGALAVPFSVTHVDAHADLGAGDAGYDYLMTDVLFRAVEDRTRPEEAPDRMWDGNFLSFAIACRWISDLTYVYNDEFGGRDLLHLHMRDYDRDADALQLKVIPPDELRRNRRPDSKPEHSYLEPAVRFERSYWRDFQASEPFEMIFLTRSPNFTPCASDALYDEIRHRFILEL